MMKNCVNILNVVIFEINKISSLEKMCKNNWKVFRVKVNYIIVLNSLLRIASNERFCGLKISRKHEENDQFKQSIYCYVLKNVSDMINK